MKESGESHPSPRRKNRLVAGMAAGAAILGAGAAVKYGPGLAEDHLMHESKIVAGVPGQVEDSKPTTVIVNGTPMQFTEVRVEQCAADIEAAKEGRQTTSFNPEIGKVAAGCVVDWVRSEASPIGSVVIFQGKVGKHLKK